MDQRLEYRIFTYSTFLQNKFGEKVFRVGLSTGITCPHRKNNGGCIFCNPNSFTGKYQSQDLSIKQQLEKAIPKIKKSCGDVKLLAYFQDETSTYGRIDFLRRKYKQALEDPRIEGLVVSTRPDYINEEIVELLSSYKVPVTIEIGMQSKHNKSLEILDRGHSFEQVEESIQLCGKAGLTIGVHLIMGIPNETYADMLQTIKWISSNKFIDQVKFHNLVVYKNTKLANMKDKPSYPIKTHIQNLSKLLPHLRGDICISRLFTSNILNSDLTLNKFTGNKTKWMNELRKLIYKDDIVQGSETKVAYDFREYFD